MNTLYDVLGVASHANEKTIRTAFRKAAKSFHPDLNAGNPTAELQFRQLVAAYELLKNPQQREAYDQQLKVDRRARVRRVASPIISGLVSGSIVALAMWLLNTSKPPEPAQTPRLAVAEVDEPAGQRAPAAESTRKDDEGRESAVAAALARDQDFPDDQPRQFAGRSPIASQPDVQTPLARELERVRAAGDAMAIWEFAVRNPGTPEAELARARLLTLIETADNVFLLQVLRIGAPDAIAERARQRLARLGVPAATDEAASPDPSSGPLEERAVSFISAQLAAWSPANTRNLAALTKAYADEVYYNGSLKPRPAVVRDKRRLLERSPERVYGVQPGSIKAECSATLCRVSGILEWQARSAARATGGSASTASGATQFEYGTIFSRGAFSILSENSSAVKAAVGQEAKQESSRQELSKQETSTQETSTQETSKQESLPANP